MLGFHNTITVRQPDQKSGFNGFFFLRMHYLAFCKCFLVCIAEFYIRYTKTIFCKGDFHCVVNISMMVLNSSILVGVTHLGKNPTKQCYCTV